MKSEDFQNHLGNIKKFLSDELGKLRVGRAVPSLIEDIKVDAYPGSDPMPIKELGSVSVPDSQSITIAPWDKSVLRKIEDAIRNSGRGLNPINEGEQIRVPVPPLTEERRKDMSKEVSKIVEQAKIRIRTLRQDAIRSVEEQEQNGVISEDDMARMKKDIEARVKDTNDALENMGAEKSAEIMKI
jgi:ribosome recycling factor